MGRHSAPEEPPPPKHKPRYRFLVAICGILVLAFTAMAIVAALYPEQGPTANADQGDPNAGNPFPQAPDPNVPTSPGAAPATTGGPLRGGTAKPAASATPTTSRNRPTGLITGAYTTSSSWDNGFIGTVELVNADTGARHWQVRLVFPNTVGEKPQSTWIAGGPGGATVIRAGGALLFDSTQPLARGGRIQLSFQISKEPNQDFAVRECSINGRACTG